MRKELSRLVCNWIQTLNYSMKLYKIQECINFENFQANRLKLRYRNGKQTTLAHTLNGSALALARIFAALLENNQTPEGIVIPKVLQHYTGFERID